MEQPTLVVQRINRVEKDLFVIAEKYYYLLSVINNLKLTERETQLIAFTAIKGSISYKHLREEFCEKHKTTGFTINNIISKLKKMNIFIKDGGKIKVNPVIVLNFNKDIKLEITLSHE